MAQEARADEAQGQEQHAEAASPRSVPPLSAKTVVGVYMRLRERSSRSPSPEMRVGPSKPASSRISAARSSFPEPSRQTVITCTLSGRAPAKAARSGSSAMQGPQVVDQKLTTVASLAAISSWVKVSPSSVPAVKEARGPGAARGRAPSRIR